MQEKKLKGTDRSMLTDLLEKSQKSLSFSFVISSRAEMFVSGMSLQIAYIFYLRSNMLMCSSSH